MKTIDMLRFWNQGDFVYARNGYTIVCGLIDSHSIDYSGPDVRHRITIRLPDEEGESTLVTIYNPEYVTDDQGELELWGTMIFQEMMGYEK